MKALTFFSNFKKNKGSNDTEPALDVEALQNSVLSKRSAKKLPESKPKVAADPKSRAAIEPPSADIPKVVIDSKSAVSAQMSTDSKPVVIDAKPAAYPKTIVTESKVIAEVKQ